MILRRVVVSALSLVPFAGLCQSVVQPVVSLPVGTPLPVTVRDHLPMKVGTPIKAERIYAVYDEDRLVLPVGTVLNGAVVSLTPDHTRRVHARLRADFTPFHVPVVQFASIVLPDGTTDALSTGEATDGAPVYRLVAPKPRTGELCGEAVCGVQAGGCGSGFRDHWA